MIKQAKEEKKHNLFYHEEEHVKTQIILCHTSRHLKDYLTGIKTRMGGEYKKSPHYLISKKGDIINNFPPNNSSEFFGDDTIDNQSVVVMLENLGWLKLNPLSGEYTNWAGDIYKGKVYQKQWRDHNFWTIYTDEQIVVLSELITKLCDKLDIEKILVGHNVKVDGIKRFNGVCSRSNYTDYWTDLSPAFEFEKLKEHLKKYEKNKD
tara:strand:+ start:6703 stop:7323 length:621 start_codon:yes stop_codon:yes gene_type:complete